MPPPSWSDRRTKPRRRPAAAIFRAGSRDSRRRPAALDHSDQPTRRAADNATNATNANHKPEGVARTMNPETPKECRFCKWYRTEEGVIAPFSFTGPNRYWKQDVIAFCCYNPPSGSVPYPWSFGETAPDLTCSKWEQAEHPADDLDQ